MVASSQRRDRLGQRGNALADLTGETASRSHKKVAWIRCWMCLAWIETGEAMLS
jgi:hypothetical protein